MSDLHVPFERPIKFINHLNLTTMFLTIIKDRNIPYASNVKHDSNGITIRVNPKQYRINTDSAIVETAISKITTSPKVSDWFKDAIKNMSAKRNLTMACINL
jgi:hypothetical protein